MVGFPDSGSGKIRGAGRDGILVLDSRRGVILEVDPFLTELLGQPRAELVGKSLADVGFFSDRAEGEAIVEIIRTEAFAFCDDFRILTGDGRCVVLEFAGNAYVADGRDVIQFNFWEVSDTFAEKSSTPVLAAGIQRSEGH